jgi:AraC family transcriptional regulator of adaptative response/methylated-DNA-[protein]-cysteine methyltransferase
MTDHNSELDYRRVEKAIRFLRDRLRDQPPLDEVAAHLGMSPYHVQRLFKRWAGVSPKRFLQYLTLEHAKRLLRDSHTVLQASYGSGLSGPSRLHDLFVAIEAVTPGEYRSEGRGVDICWGVHPTPFGRAFLAATDRGLTSLSFLAGEGVEGAIESLHEAWPKATLVHAPDITHPIARRVFREPARRTSPTASRADARDPDRGPTLRIHVRGTNFQLRVWAALLEIPVGAAVTYADVARAIGEPRAARAVGQAVSHNPVAVIIPCHRVLRSAGAFGRYRWGQDRKKAILGWESAHVENHDDEA